jgi:hypothetical protein
VPPIRKMWPVIDGTPCFFHTLLHLCRNLCRDRQTSRPFLLRYKKSGWSGGMLLTEMWFMVALTGSVAESWRHRMESSAFGALRFCPQQPQNVCACWCCLWTKVRAQWYAAFDECTLRVGQDLAQSNLAPERAACFHEHRCILRVG